MAITNAQQARQMYKEGGRPMKKIKGQDHMLAYITPNEAEKLKALGGQETMTKEGIPAYPEFDNYGFSSQADFDSGDVSRSNDPNVRGEGPGQNRVTAAELSRRNEIARKTREEFEKRERERKAKEVEKKVQKTKKAKTKKIKDFITADDLLNEKSKLDDSRFDKADLNKDGKVGIIERYNYNQRKTKQKNIQDRIDKKIRSGLEIVDPNINLTRSIKEMEMNMPTASYGDLVKEAVLGGSTFGNKGDLIGAQFEKFSPKEGSAQEKYDYQPDFFTPITTDSPSLTVQGAAALGNIFGGIFGNKTPYEGKMTDLADLYDKAADLDLSKTSTRDMMKEFEPNRYALANNMIYDPIRKTFRPKPDNGGGGQQPILPIVQPPKDDKDSEEEDPFQLALAFRKDGGRVPYEDGGYTGGIMDLESGRQMYFLGKLVKKATRAVKKIVKSPVGKIGLGALMFGGLGGFSGLSGGLGGFAKKFGFDAIKKKIGEASFGKLAGLSIGGGLLAGALAGKGYEDEDGDGFDDKTGFSVEEYRKRGAQGNVPIAFRAEGGMSDVESDPQYKGWKRIFEVNPEAAEMHPKHTEFVKYYRSTERETKAEGGMMDLKGMEMDFREDGGFVPIGKKERADDVPARLSKNEFVMTADAVRGAGDGNIDKGAEKMYNLMSKLEAENDQSQGLDGARKMFQTAQRLEEVL